MMNRTPTPRDERPALPAFDAVPRQRSRHDGWTPERQVAFIEALADTGSVKSAAAQVNMSSESAYALRRAPGAAGFARAWEAALDMGLLRLKDEAFDRALHGELVPIVSGGKLLGYRRKRSDRLLTFLLRHYGAGGERLPDGPLAPPPRKARRHRRAEPDTPDLADATVEPTNLPTPSAERALVPAPPASAAAIVAEFEGVALDEEAQAQIVAVLTACAARARSVEVADDPAEVHVPEADLPPGHPDAVHTSSVTIEEWREPRDGDEDWRTLDLPDQREAIAAAVAAIEAKKASGEWEREKSEERAADEAELERKRRFSEFLNSGASLDYWKE